MTWLVVFQTGRKSVTLQAKATIAGVGLFDAIHGQGVSLRTESSFTRARVRRRWLPALAPQIGNDSQPAARFLGGAFVLLGALLGALQISNETVVDLSRDQGTLTAAAFACGAAALIAGAVGAWGCPKDSRGERISFLVGFAMLGSALVLGVVAAVGFWGQRPQPSIAATPTADGSAVDVAVEARGLRASDRIVVSVEQLVQVVSPGGESVLTPGVPLYGASLAPRPDGKIEKTIRVTLPAGDFDDLAARVWLGKEPTGCYEEGNTTGCVTVHLVRRAERPQLRVRWGDRTRAGRTLHITFDARNIPGKAVSLRALGGSQTLAAWSLAPDVRGNFRRSLHLAVPSAVRVVCVTASTVRPLRGCSGRRSHAVWAILTNPQG